MKKNNIFTKRTVSNIIVVTVGILLYLSISNLSTVRSTFSWFFNILSPFITGIGIAYLLNIPLSYIERRFLQKIKHKRGLSILITYLLSFVCLFFVVGMALPHLLQSVVSLVGNISGYIENFDAMLAWVTETFNLQQDTLDFIAVSYADMVTQVVSLLRNALPQLINYTVKLGSSVVNVLTAIIASIYFLGSKEKILMQIRRVVYAFIPRRNANEVYRVATLSNKVFSGFISGKLLDSLIIGIICYVFMAVMNLWVYEMPYAPLISVIVGITNIIPFFGPFIGAIPSAMLLLLVNPVSAIIFVAFIIVLQQFDGNILGPKILGDKTGLPAMWVLIAIVVGGGVFGFAGMVLGVPTAAVLYTLASDIISKRLIRRGITGKQLQAQTALETSDATTPPDDTGQGLSAEALDAAENGVDAVTLPATSMEADKGMD